MRILDIDGPLIQFLSKMADLMWLNILTMICCIPIITAGASLTALNYMALKIVRNEEGYITRGFFKAFKENFKQSTAIWCLFLVVACVLGVDYRIMTTTDVKIGNVLQMLILITAMMTVFTLLYVFPVQAKFSNSIMRTIWNAFVLSIVQFPKTILMIVLYALPHVMVYLWNGIFPVSFVFCLSLPALLSAKLYNKLFMSLENKILAQSEGGEQEPGDGEEDERIFRDELDESIEIGQNN
ncbi:MAG: YesL family protein [Acetatifactor sp.]|nr:YesL family protein [Acetatifactor sp.]MDE6700903.1 YesL family protein [Acetatifactor sp.]MDE7113721.1 YesL family protein [Acetatifactor sp.]